MRRRIAALAAAFAAMGIFLAVIMNGLFSPDFVWWYYAAFGLLWWPLGAALLPRRIAAFSLVGSALTIVFLATINLQTSPGHPWFLYALPALACWPVVILAGRRAGTAPFASLAAAAVIACYAALNASVSPGYPWAIYPAFAIVWWPMSLYFARRRQWFGYSVAGALWIAAFFIAVNAVSSPGAIWAVYPIFAVVWWPLAVYFFKYKREKIS